MGFVNQNIKPLNTKRNSKGNLEIAGCDLVELAEKYSTPLYVMDKNTLVQMAVDYKEAFAPYEKVKMMYASKALMTGTIAKILYNLGFGFDVVSIGEMYTLHHAGIDLTHATFNGNNKDVDEIEYALEYNIGRVSVDSFYELEFLNECAKKRNKVQKILLRINPHIECHTHEYIQTGQLDSKFGIDLSNIVKAVDLIVNKYTNLELKGFHAHVGSQIFETKVFEDEIDVLLREIKRIDDLFNLTLDEINIGGGLGVTYVESDHPPDVYKVADIIIKAIEKNCKKYNVSKPTLLIEPGRSLVSTAGVSLYTIGATKDIKDIRKYVSVNGGMADNPRPSTYQAEYSAEIANGKASYNPEVVTVSGRYCESGDVLIKDIELNSPKAGDILCVYNTGAYCYSMASNYNSTLKCAMVLLENGKSDIIVKRQTLEQLVQNDIILD